MGRPVLNHRIDHRGDQTRERILEAAIEVFAAEGYEGASTRALAAKAGVNQPAIQYHFASKEGLYQAAIQSIAAQIEAHMGGPAAAVMTALKDKKLTQEALFDLLFWMLDTFADMVIQGTAPEACGAFLSRAEVENSSALNPFSQTIHAQLIVPCASIVGRLLGKSAQNETVIMRTLCLLGQVLVFKNKGPDRNLRRALGWTEFKPKQIKLAKSLIREQTKAMILCAMKKKS
jgi:AcrR family transcriptional regulator